MSLTEIRVVTKHGAYLSQRLTLGDKPDEIAAVLFERALNKL